MQAILTNFEQQRGNNIMQGRSVQSTPDVVEKVGRRSQLPEEEHQKIAAALKNDLCFPTDTQEFARFRDRSSVYVDKSLLIKDVIESGQHLLLTCPRRWGKSLNLDMLKAFFQPNSDDPKCSTDGTIARGKYNFDGAQRNPGLGSNPQQQSEYKDANKNLRYFKKLHIDGQKTVIHEINADGAKTSKVVDIIEHYQGKRPVICLDLKNVRTDNIDNARIDLRSAIAKAYKEHDYLYYSKLLEEIENYNELNPGQPIVCQGKNISFFEQAISNKITISPNLAKLQTYYHGKTNAEAAINESLSFLSKLLCEYYGKERRVIILIDEYDAAVNKLLEENFLKQEAERKTAEALMKSISTEISRMINQCAKTNHPHVEKIVLTGITNALAKEAGSNLNNINEHGVLDLSGSGGNFAQYFGFSEKELKEQILDKIFNEEFVRNKNIQDSLYEIFYDKLKYWYNGQVIGKEEIFTPSSIINHLEHLEKYKTPKATQSELKFQGNWEKSGSSNILANLGSVGISNDLFDKLKDLATIDHVDTTKTCKLNIGPHETVNIYDLINTKNPNIDKIVQYLLIKGGYISRVLGKGNTFKLPAREAQYAFRENVLKHWLAHRTGMDTNAVEAFAENFLENIGDAESLKKLLNTNLPNMTRLKNLKETEADFQVIMNSAAMLAEVTNSSADYICRSEVGVGGKRIDGLFIPREKGDTIVIHEYKKSDEAKKDKSKDLLLEDAVWQICANRYMSVISKLNSTEIQNVIIRGIVFSCSDRKWNVAIKEHKMTKGQAIIIDNLFSQDGKGEKLLDNSEDLIGRGRADNNARSDFLKNLECKSLDALLEKDEAELNRILLSMKGEEGQIYKTNRNSERQPTAKGKSKRNGGITIFDEGLSDEEVRDKLLEYSDELKRRDGIALQTEICDTRTVLGVIDKWHFKNVNHGFIGMVKLNDPMEESNHAVLVYGRRDNRGRSSGVTFQIVDPFDKWTAKKYFANDRETLLKSLKDGPKLFGELHGEIKTEVGIKYLDKQSIDESNCVQLCLDEVKKEVMHSRLQEIANCTKNTTVLIPVAGMCNNDTLGRIQDTLISFHNSIESRHRIILPLFHNDRWHIMVLDLERSKAVIDALHYGTMALPNALRRALTEMLNTALEESMCFKPLVRLMRPNGQVTPSMINIPNYDIKIRDEYNSTITDTKKLTDQIYHAITGRYMWSTQSHSESYFSRSSTNYTANRSSLFWGNQDNLRIANTSEPRMDIERKCEVPANSLFGTRSTNIFGSNPNHLTRVPNQSNESLVKSSIQKQRGFFGNTWARPQSLSESKFFKS